MHTFFAQNRDIQQNKFHQRATTWLISDNLKQYRYICVQHKLVTAQDDSPRPRGPPIGLKLAKMLAG